MAGTIPQVIRTALVPVTSFFDPHRSFGYPYYEPRETIFSMFGMVKIRGTGRHHEEEGGT
jgi:hypothetical protein